MTGDQTLTATRCPKCHGDLVVYERQGIVVDQCRDCRGIWLDRGELEHLIDLEARAAARSAGPRVERPASAPPPAGVPPYADPWPPERSERRPWHDDDDDDDRYDDRRRDGRPRRKQGFLGDLLEGFLE